MFEKIVHSKVYWFIDHILKILFINFLMLISLILGLVIFSIGPTILAGVYTTKLVYQKYEGSIWTVYFTAFKRFYKKSTLISFIYVIVGLVLAYNINYFYNGVENDFTWYSFVFLILTIMFFSFISISYINTLLIYSCFDQSDYKDLFKNGMKLTLAFMIRSVLATITIILIIILSLVVPIIVLLISFYLFTLIVEMIIFKAYDKIKAFDNISTTTANSLIR